MCTDKEEHPVLTTGSQLKDGDAEPQIQHARLLGDDRGQEELADGKEAEARMKFAAGRRLGAAASFLPCYGALNGGGGGVPDSGWGWGAQEEGERMRGQASKPFLADVARQLLSGIAMEEQDAEAEHGHPDWIHFAAGRGHFAQHPRFQFISQNKPSV